MVGALRILITGGNAGVGFEAARQLLKLGHHAIIACRDADKAKKAVDALTPVAKGSGASVDFVLLDLASLASVRSAAEQLLARHPRLDVLLCNAGMLSRRGSSDPLELTKDGFEATLQVNHLGHFLLVHLLLPALLASPASRVVMVSSELHRKATAAVAVPAAATATSPPSPGATAEPPAAVAAPTQTPTEPDAGAGAPAAASSAGVGALPLASPDWLVRLSASKSAATAAATAEPPPPRPTGFQLYCISKLYNLWFAYRLATLLPPTVKVNGVTPGWVPGTSLGRDMPWLARMSYQYLFPLIPGTVSVAEGGRRVVAVCVGAQEGAVTGAYFSRGAQADSSPESHDLAAAERLWRLSEEAAGINGPYLPPAAPPPVEEQPQPQPQQQQQEQLQQQEQAEVKAEAAGPAPAAAAIQDA